MKFILDTNICIYLIKQQPIKVVEKFKRYTPEQIGLSTITISELQYGVLKSKKKNANKKALDLFLTPFEIFNFDSKAASEYGKIRSDLEKKGTPIGGMDLLIAAHTLRLERTLVTNNESEFRRVTGLKVVNWLN